MIRFFKIALVLTLSILFANCTKNNTDVTPIPAEPYAVQYPKDTLKIVEYMNNYSMTVDADYNVEFIKADSSNPSIKMKFGDAGTKQLKFNIVKRDGVDYKVYYIPLREGTGDKPIEVDSVFASYTGRLVSDNIVFDKTPTPIWFTLDNVIQGWRKIFPLFKSGDKTVNTITGSVTYNNYGAGVIFIPSGLAYYNSNTGLC
jgi:FKBP-type peptidyl-prolyl cis-trans isomerase FkpA